MKILKTALILAGITLIVYALYNSFFPKEILDIRPVEMDLKKGFNNQTVGMIGVGIIALIAGALLKKNR